MGTPSFAVPSLSALAESHEVVGVYTRPDAVSGRGSGLRPSPVKERAVELGLTLRQPTTLRDTSEHEALRALEADICVVAAYGLILPPGVLDAPRLGCVNVHASLLPRWRGAAPVQRAILAGDRQTGVSIMRMEEGLDTGPFCVVRTVEVDEKSSEELTAELAREGASALLDALDRIGEGVCVWQEQDDASATYAEKVSKADVAPYPTLGAMDAVRRVRASSAQAPARVIVDGRRLTVLHAGLVDLPLGVGAVAVTRSGIALGFEDGAIEVTELKPDGKGAMRASDWARGARVTDGASWGAA